MAHKPTMADVARRAGVSTATVSRALKKPRQVTEETRQRIQAAIRETGYVPNSLARNLRTQRSGTVMLVVRDIGNPFYLEIFRGVEAAARARGLSVLMANTENDADRERGYFDMVRQRSADGMILMTGKLPADYASGETGPLPPLVVALEYLPDSGLPTVQIDNVAASASAADHLIGLGHRRIAHIAGPLPEVMSADRLAGYRQAMSAAGLPVDDGLIARGDFTIEAGHAAALTLLARADRPTGITCANDEMAMGAISAARELALRVPEDVSVVGFDDIIFARHFSPPLTTVAQPRHAIGERAMELLAARLDGEPPPEAPIIMPTRVVPRASSAAAPSRVEPVRPAG